MGSDNTQFKGWLRQSCRRHRGMRLGLAGGRSRIAHWLAFAATHCKPEDPQGHDDGNYTKRTPEIGSGYTDTDGNEFATRLEYDTSWSVTGITPDTRDASLWNSGETATIRFTLSPTAKDATSGTVIVVTPLAISDSEYFDCSIS